MNGLRRMLRVLRLAEGSPQAGEAARIWMQAQTLARPRTFSAPLGLADFLDRFAPYARQSRHLMRRLEGFGQVRILAVTLGPALEDRAAALFAAGLAFESYVLGRMGTYLVDRAMRDLAARYAAQSPVGSRYSPGYNDFALEAQGPLVAMAARDLPELSLTAGLVLRPAMSVTAVMGFGNRDERQS